MGDVILGAGTRTTGYHGRRQALQGGLSRDMLTRVPVPLHVT